MSKDHASLERLALRTIRALCLTAEAALHYFTHFDANAYTKFDRHLPIHCADFAEHIAQDVLDEGRSQRFILESLLRDLHWLAQFDRAELHKVTCLAVPSDDDLAAIRSDVEAALAETAAA